MKFNGGCDDWIVLKRLVNGLCDGEFVY